MIAGFLPTTSITEDIAKYPKVATRRGKLASKPNCTLVRANSFVIGRSTNAKIAISHPSENELENVTSRAQVAVLIHPSLSAGSKGLRSFWDIFFTIGCRHEFSAG
jgi:hypothetical protein